MKKPAGPMLALAAAAFALTGCVEGLQAPGGNGIQTIAIPSDGGADEGVLLEGEAAIAYDPDGCQGWIIDDGTEGYSGRRFDPVTGLPICNNLYPPGTVIGPYEAASNGMRDWVPRQ